MEARNKTVTLSEGTAKRAEHKKADKALRSRASVSPLGVTMRKGMGGHMEVTPPPSYQATLCRTSL